MLGNAQSPGNISRDPRLYRRIFRPCADALEGDAEDDDARAAFLEAAHEAKIAITLH